MLALLVRFLIGLVEIFSVIGDLANRWIGGWRDLYEIESTLAGKLDRLKRHHHAQLPAVFIHHSNFTRSDAVIDSNPVGLPKTAFSDKPTSTAPHSPASAADTTPPVLQEGRGGQY